MSTTRPAGVNLTASGSSPRALLREPDPPPDVAFASLLQDDDESPTDESVGGGHAASPRSDRADPGERRRIPRLPRGLVATLVRAIHVVRRSGQVQSLRLDLADPKLDGMGVRLSQTDAGLVVCVDGASAVTRAELRQAIPELMTRMTEQGVELAGVEVRDATSGHTTGDGRDDDEAPGDDEVPGVDDTVVPDDAPARDPRPSADATHAAETRVHYVI